MAASISSTPGERLLPLRSQKLWYTLTGYVPASDYKYRYVIDVYVNTVQVARVLRVPDAGSNDATFNLRALVEEYLEANPQGDSGFALFDYPQVTGDFFDLGECIRVDVKIGESVAASATGEPVLTANQDTEILFLHNGKISPHQSKVVADFYHINNTSYLLSDRRPETYRWYERGSYPVDSDDIFIPIWSDGYYILSFLNDNGTYAPGSAATQVEYVISDGSTESSQLIEINATVGAALPGGTVAATQKVIRMAAGPGNLDAVTDPTITDPPSSMNWPYYKLRLVDAGGIAMSRWYVFVNRGDCSKHNRYAIFWFNDSGGWDSFDGFTGVTVKDNEIQRKFYRRAVTGPEEPWENDHLKPTQVETQRIFRIRSEYLQPGEFSLLRSAMTSKNVYLHSLDEGEEFMAVTLKMTSYTERDVEVGKVFDLVIDCHLASLDL